MHGASRNHDYTMKESEGNWTEIDELNKRGLPVFGDYVDVMI